MVNEYLISHLAAGDSLRTFLATDPETALTACEVTSKDVEHELVERLRLLLALPADALLQRLLDDVADEARLSLEPNQAVNAAVAYPQSWEVRYSPGAVVSFISPETMSLVEVHMWRRKAAEPDFDLLEWVNDNQVRVLFRDSKDPITQCH